MTHLLIRADARRIPLADRSVQCVVTSPPYFGLRDYGVSGQLGLEATPAEFVAAMVAAFREIHRVLRDDGTLWLNIGDSYANDAKGARGVDRSTLQGSAAYQYESRPPRASKDWRRGGFKKKNRLGIPHRLVFALQDDGWHWRDEIVWAKRNAIPESVRDRTTKAHEFVFLLTKSPRYFYDLEAGKEKAVGGTPGNITHKGKTAYEAGDIKHRTKVGLTKIGAVESRNSRSVWFINTQPFKGAHFATMPRDLAARCIRLGTSDRGCCPACGSPWRRVVSRNRYATRPDRSSKYADPKLDRVSHDRGRHLTEVRSLGWESSCTCIEPSPVPCRVFDPFGGAMTTVMVAESLGREGIAAELSAEYLSLGKTRLERPHAPAVRKSPAVATPTMPLFRKRRAGSGIVANPSLASPSNHTPLPGQTTFLDDLGVGEARS